MIGWLPHSTNPVYAGSRIRCLTPLRQLRGSGFPIELYDPPRASAYRAVIVQGLCCLPSDSRPLLSGDALLTQIPVLKRSGCRIVVEDCDNHFYNPKDLPKWRAAAQRLRALLQMSDHIIASTESIASVYRVEAPQNTPMSIIGDAVETQADLNFEPLWRRVLSPSRKLNWLAVRRLQISLAMDRRRGRTQLVWFGSHGGSYADGGMLDLLRLRELLENLSKRHPIALTVISNNPRRYLEAIESFALPTRYFPWSRTNFLPALRAHDIALIPITRSPFTECKSNNRLLLALKEGLAVCADGIPSYQEFAHFCSLDDWEAGLERYIQVPALRRAHVAEARRTIEQGWTAELIAQRWRRVLETVLGRLSIGDSKTPITNS